MGLFKRMATFLGFLHVGGDEGDGSEEEDRAGGKDEGGRRASSSSSSAFASAVEAPAASRRRFSVQVPVAVERAQVGPILVPCEHGDGGVQGFKWYGKKLRIDEDGDVAEEFLDEVLPEEASFLDSQGTLPTFKINFSSRPAAVRNQIFASDGSVRHGVEHRGRLKWI